MPLAIAYFFFWVYNRWSHYVVQKDFHLYNATLGHQSGMHTYEILHYVLWSIGWAQLFFTT